MAKILDGKKLSEEIVSKLRSKVEGMKKTPRLDIILVGENPASKIYVRNKKLAAEKAGIKGELHTFPEFIKQTEVIALIMKLNSDKDVTGILVQLPLPKHFDEKAVTDAIVPEKDVDGMTTYSIGRLSSGNPLYEPCTPKGIIRLLENEGIDIEGKHAVVIGRSNIVGKPVSLMLLKKNATVTVCHSRTKNIDEHMRNADILVAAMGKPRFVTENMVKKDAIVVDVGINREGGKIVGDVDFDAVSKKAAYITPVPGGVGPMTIAMLLENTVKAAEHNYR